MSQFNAAKNPPWVRTDNFSVPQMTQPAMHQHQMLTTQMPPVVQYQQNPGQQTATVYQAQLALQQQALTVQQNLQQMANTQIYNPQLNTVATGVAARNLNAAAFAQPVVAATSTAPPTQVTNLAPATTGTKQRVFTGIVTKVLDTYGFVDEDVFFQLSVVKGPAPVVNDRVLVEAVCLPNMPFKWNATRIQVLPMNNAQRNNKKGFIVTSSPNFERGNYSAVPPMDFDDLRRERDRDRDRRRRRSRERNRNRSPVLYHDDEKRRKERKDRDEKEKEREKERERDRARSRSVKKSNSKQRVVKKYRVRVPDYPLDTSNLSLSDVRNRYHTMYVPSDFFRTSIKWQGTGSLYETEFSKNVQFHILSKDVERIVNCSDDLEPPDADYLFCAKVMLLSVPPKDTMMKKCMQLTEDLEKDEGEKNLSHHSRLINCLVGANTRSKNEIMAIGGPWSPSLDGADPAGDVNVLIKTAIRTCRALTGIDLTPCTHWYRFVEIYYHRPKSTHKGKQIPARVETVVVYIPDVNSAMPSCLEWEKLQADMKKQMDKTLNEAGKEQTEIAPDDEKVENLTANLKEPTHYSQLDPKVMKVSELRDELEARNMSSKGLRLQLLARLSKVLKTEQETAEQEEKDLPKVLADKEKEAEEEKLMKLEKEKKKAEQKNRAMLEEKYVLPETPHVLVYPSRIAKSGKFSCKVMSLSSLLDYSSDVTKEHSFEVFLFAELFNEMLMWDYGMQIYRALLSAPDAEAEKVDDSEKKKGEKGKDEKDDKSTEEEKGSDKTEEKKNESEKPDQNNVSNGNEREESRDSSEDDDDDCWSRDSSGYRKDRRDERRDRKRKNSVAMYTAYPDLLLAFTFFDVSRYGFISKSHLEDLIHALGLQLSRSQVKRLLTKVTHRDHCEYRRLTDLPVGTNPTEETILGESSLSLELGNKAHLPLFEMRISQPLENVSPPLKRSKILLEKETDSEKESEGLVYYKSVLVNIHNLKEQVTRNETARLKTEEKLTELKREIEELRDKSKKSCEEIKTLEKELKSCKFKLQITTAKLSEQVASSDVYLSALMDIEERLIPVLDTDEIKRLIKVRQSISGAPSINLIPLTKVEDITKMDDNADLEEDKLEKSTNENGSVEKYLECTKTENQELEEKMEI